MRGPAISSFFLPALVVTSFLWAEVGVPQQQASLVLSGTVRSSASGEPVDGALVQVDRLSGTSGPHGRFRFEGLAPGRHTLAVRTPDTPILIREYELAPGPVPLNIEVWITPRSAVSGRVADGSGDPVAAACVVPMRREWRDGASVLRAVTHGQSCTTDEDGRYSVSVEPGEYYIRVQSQRSGSASTRPAIPHAYYPRAASPEVAVPVRVPVGTDVPGIDLTVGSDVLVPLRFTFVLPEEVPGLQAPLSAYLPEGKMPVAVRAVRIAPGLRTEPYDLEVVSVGQDVYLTTPVAAGDYELIFEYPASTWNAVYSYMTRQGLNPVLKLRVSVMPEDAGDDGVLDIGTITKGPRWDVAGRAVARRTRPADTTRRFPEPFFGTVVVSGNGREIGVSPMNLVLRDPVFGDRQVESMSSDGDLAFEHVVPGVYVLELDGIPSGWYLESLRNGARDVLRDGLDVTGAAGPLDIVLADDGGRLEGVARDGSGTPVPGAHLILIPPASGRGPMTKFRRGTADPTGAFRLEDVRPGEYRVLAFDLRGRPAPAAEEPVFLSRYESRGERITVDPGARLTINPETIPLAY